MKYLQNLHVHSTYCDGKDTPEEMIRTALKKSFHSIGFSGHSYMEPSAEYTMTAEVTEDYRREILRLKEVYRDQIEIFLGLEADMYSEVSFSGYEYLIGSLHCLKKADGQYLAFDRSAQAVQTLIDDHFDGDGMAFAKEYFRQLAHLPEYGSFDILGHFDIHTKNIEKIPFFDTGSREYLDAAYAALEKLQGKIPYFEVNTGAISRGYRTSPYPAENLLGPIGEMGFGAVISSDCHDRNFLDCGYEMARQLLLNNGFRECFVLTRSGFEAVPL